MKKRFLTTGEIARICEVSAKTVISWTEKEQLQAYRIGNGPRRVSVQDFQSFLEARDFPPSVSEEFQRMLSGRVTQVESLA